ncbi:unnamed protein product, partial [Prorocentrum cordatum]
MADVVRLRRRARQRVPLRPLRATWVAQYEDLCAVKQSDIPDVGAHVQAASRTGGQRSSPHITPLRDEAGRDAAPAQLSRTLAALRGVARDRAQSRQRGPGLRNVCVVRPAALDAHVAEAAAGGERHCTAPRADQSKTHFALDIPLPLQLEVGAHRCETRHARGTRDCGFPATLADVRAACPGVLVLQTEKHGLIFATRFFLLHLLRNFSETFCGRASRRAIAEDCSAHCLAFSMGSRALWYLSAVPSNCALRAFICDALENYLAPLVEHMRKHVDVYSGSVVRGGDNWGLAARVLNNKEREFSVILGWIGVDGALLKPVIASKTEDLVDLLPDLDDVVSSLKRDRLQAGLGLAAIAPICHCTGVYGKHRFKLAEFYMGKYPEQTTTVVADTPKADGSQAVDRFSEPLTAIAGDPVHDAAASVIALRRCASPSCNDCRDFIRDHQDILSRLSAPPPGAPPAGQAPARSRAQDLSEAGVALLRTAVEKTVATFQASMGAEADGAADLRRFLQLPNVSKCCFWKKEFGAYLPRGVVSRIARRAGVQVDSSMAFRGHASPKQVKAERVRGLRGVWTAMVRAHYRRLLKPLRVEGLWAWQSAAPAIRAAGVPVQSGTVPVERLWECLKGVLPRGARTVSLRWFNVLGQLAFLQFNYRHYGAGRLPPWAERDALLAQRLEAVVMLGVELEDDDGLDHMKH